MMGEAFVGVAVGLLVIAAALGLRVSLGGRMADALTERFIEVGSIAWCGQAHTRRRTGHGLRAFVGRLHAQRLVTAPSGVVAACYQAELRVLDTRGRPGLVLTKEREAAPGLALVAGLPAGVGDGDGAPSGVRLGLDEVRLEGPMRAQRCAALLPTAGWSEPLPAMMGSLFHEATTYERCVKSGERCVVLGRLCRGQGDARLRIRGWAGAAVLVREEDAAWVARSLRARAWRAFALAAGCCVGAAFLFARAV